MICPNSVKEDLELIIDYSGNASAGWSISVGLVPTPPVCTRLSGHPSIFLKRRARHPSPCGQP
jgi:hypothetical protein